MKREKGITLIALVITIIVLLILAGVALATLTGQGNIIGNAENAVGKYNNGVALEQEILNTIGEYFENYANKDKNKDITTATEIQNKTEEFYDSNGNKIVVPGGFKVKTDLATTVEEGIVIEDSDGNQFVWVPVGKVIKNDGSEVNIELARYTFAEDGTANLEQSANDYEQDVAVLETYHTEKCVYEKTSYVQDLGEFIESTQKNGGYYIGRYEYAGDGSKAGYSPKSDIVKSTAMSLSKALYSENDFVASNMVNSYAWDTAILYIESCSELSDYARHRSLSNYGTAYEISNTGESTDVVCNIYDMCGNLCEWSTEYSSAKASSSQTYYSCVYRGGSVYPNDNHYTSYRHYRTNTSNEYIGFRVVLWVL